MVSPEYKAAKTGAPNSPHSPQNKEWICETLAHRDGEKAPYNFLFTPPARGLLEAHYGTSKLEECLDFPIRMSGCRSVKPLYADPAEFGASLRDEFGVTWTTSVMDRGSPTGPCLLEPDLTSYSFPDAAENIRFEGIESWCRHNQSHYKIIWVGDLWERATFMRGMENLLLDVAMHPAFVEELLRGIAEFILQTMTILFERFAFEGIAVSDDYGTQKGMLISPRDWRRVIKPLLSEIYSLAKRNGRTVFHHSCGNIRPIIAEMIEIGLDILHPIQPEAMDIFELKREYGRDLTFCGGVRTHDLLPFGTPEEVRAEVRELKREMGYGGGYIIESGITLQADVPLENLVALIDEARKAT